MEANLQHIWEGKQATLEGLDTAVRLNIVDIRPVISQSGAVGVLVYVVHILDEPLAQLLLPGVGRHPERQPGWRDILRVDVI